MLARVDASGWTAQGRPPAQFLEHAGKGLIRLVPHKQLSLDQALEFVRDDECIEVTPELIRLRKVALDQNSRVKAARRRAREPAGA